MLFNSLHFLVFLPVVFALHWSLGRKNMQGQNALLLAASLYFYGCWDPRFLLLLLFSIALDYWIGLRIGSALPGAARRAWLVASISANLGFLAVFKYYNFFSAELAAALGSVGLSVQLPVLQVLLPIGISFYTFHGLSYVFDCYRQRIRPEHDFVRYAVFVAFFPLLVAGPIERATHLLPQLKTARTFEHRKAIEGLRQILWGFFKKLALADPCGLLAASIFKSHSTLSAPTHWLGAVLFSIQIYGDFSGYSDIAIGTARLFGIDLVQNFHYPYFSRDIAEFWRRWHMSLSRWFRDYVYIPLGGSKTGRLRAVRNTVIVFLLSGLWHGANWTFIAWGALHALFFLPLLLLGRNRKHLDLPSPARILPRFGDLLRMLITFALVTFAWIPFRSPNMRDAIEYWRGCFHGGGELYGVGPLSIPLLLITAIVFTTEWIGRGYTHPLAALEQRLRYTTVRWSLYAVLIFLIGMNMPGDTGPFIYFQF